MCTCKIYMRSLWVVNTFENIPKNRHFTKLYHKLSCHQSLDILLFTCTSQHINACRSGRNEYCNEMVLYGYVGLCILVEISPARSNSVVHICHVMTLMIWMMVYMHSMYVCIWVSMCICKIVNMTFATAKEESITKSLIMGKMLYY